MQLNSKHIREYKSSENIQFFDFWRFQLSIYRVWHEESDFQVEIKHSLRLDGQSLDFRTYKIFNILFLNLLFFFFYVFLNLIIGLGI